MEEIHETSGEVPIIPRGILPWPIPLTPRSPGQGPITPAEIQPAYEQAFNVPCRKCIKRLLCWLSGFRGPFYFADQYYQPVDEELLQMILDADTGDKEEYETEFYDCDDFAFRLMGWFHMDRDSATWPLFITWVETPQGGHAVLSYYQDGQVFIIEPQTDQVFPVPMDWSLILLCG
jgi:hypothetical protein